MVVVGRATSSVTTPFDRIAQHKNNDADGAKERENCTFGP
jgi:hypothetical protein